MDSDNIQNDNLISKINKDESETPENGLQETQEEVKDTDNISYFWPRIFAYILDIIIICIVGLVLGLIFGEIFIQMGTYARFVGFVLIFSYFGIFNSKIKAGQTYGKKAMNIQVVDRNYNLIPPGKSFLRSFILIIPFYFNNFLPTSILISNTYIFIWASFFIFFIGLIYFYIFNTKSRQSIHDLICGTFVVKSDLKHKSNLESEPLSQSFLTGLVIVIFIFLGILSLFKNPIYDQETAKCQVLAQRLIQEDMYYNPLVQFRYFQKFKPGKTNENSSSIGKVIIIQVNWKGEKNDIHPEIYKLADIALKTYPDADNLDYIAVRILRGFNIGLAFFNYSDALNFTPSQWKDEIAKWRKENKTDKLKTN
jgi:uncharacterized RDD family membrane protein YckC